MKLLTRKNQCVVLGLMLPVWLWLSGCDSTASLERQWFGKSKETLLASWGQPTRIEESPDGGTLYIYTRTYYPDYQESIGSPAAPSPYSHSRDGTPYPLQIRAESSTAKFWITPEGRIYRVQGRIIE